MGRLLSLATLAVLCSSTIVAAQTEPPQNPPAEQAETPPPATSTPEVDTRPPEEIAREAYAAGEAHYARGEYAEAEAAFIRAYQAVHNPVVLIAVSESRARLRRGVAAVEALELYLRVRPNAADADAVRARIESLRDTPGTLHLTTEPPGASITIDGEETGLVTPADIELPAGTHLVRVSLAGYEIVEGPLPIEYASRQEVNQVLSVPAPETPEGDAAGELEDEPEPERQRLSPALIGTMSTAAGTLIAGTVLGFTALSRESDYKRHPSESTAQEGERFALFADLSFGIAIAATATSVVLYLTGREDAPADEDTAEEPAVSVHVAPVLGRSVHGLSMTLSF